MRVSHRVANGCDYCIAAHTALATEDFGLAPEESAAIRAGLEPANPRPRVLWVLTREIIGGSGRPSAPALEGFFAAGYRPEQLLEIILAIALKVMSNYTGRLALPPLDPRFEPYGEPRGAPTPPAS